MELGFFTQPIHTPGRAYAETLEEDRQTFILADRLGYAEGFIGEHMTAARENVANGLIFLASLADATENIKLGTGVHNLAFSHPLVVASNVAMLDHMLRGRFLFGIGAGITFSDAEALGILDEDRRAMFEEAIEQVLALWQGEPPYDLEGRYWNISTARTSWPELGLGAVAKPYQLPHPPIFAGSGDPQSKSVAGYGRRGWSILSSDTLPVSRLAEQWDRYESGCAEGGHRASRESWRIVRAIFVADDEETAESYGRSGADSPYRFHFNEFHEKFRKGRMLHMFKADLAVPDEEVTLDYALDNCVIAGTVDKVVEEILAMREEVGPFGTLVYAGKNWTDPALSRRSMELMAEAVMPAVKAAIGTEEWLSVPTAG
ncbi:MAG: LLM class flavin-dependent oxidoreductase [Actinobacteria bacterium]|nr:LLM class flavin-dependent oxidoreductase [Actinomycetota bacterium]